MQPAYLERGPLPERERPIARQRAAKWYLVADAVLRGRPFPVAMVGSWDEVSACWDALEAAELASGDAGQIVIDACNANGGIPRSRFQRFQLWRQANQPFRKEIRDELYSVSGWFNPKVI